MNAVQRVLASVLLALAMLTTIVAALPTVGVGPDAGPLDPTGSTGPDPPAPDAFDDPISNPQVGVRPLLVVLLEFTDIQHDPVLTPAFIQNQIFGPRPSMNDFYLEQSYGQFSFSDQGNWAWVTAYDDPATAAADESTRSYWENYSDPTYGGGIYFRWALKSLDQAGFNFAPLDFDSDGDIDFGQEVAYLIVDANYVNEFGGAMRGMPSGLTLDGKAIQGVACAVSGGTPWITLYAHELAHQTSWGGPWFLTDYYGIIPEIIGGFTLMGFSGVGGTPPQPLGPWHLDPLSKMKLGWYAPTVVASDGFVDIADAETNAVAYLLHDAAHGKGEYFLVENRWKGTSYDNSDQIGPLPAPFAGQGAAIDIADEGILIWHIDEARSWNGSETGGFAKVDLIRRVVGNDGQAAFDGLEAGNYDFWDNSAPENARWNDATNSKAGVWCVGPRGATMRAFLDVPGPGVLLCSDPLSTSAVPGFAGSVTVPVRNTGDASDTYSFSAIAPGDVSVTLPSPITLGSKAAGTVTVDLTPLRACTTGPGPRTITIVATSTVNAGVSGSVDVTLDVLPYGEPQAALAAVDDDVEPGSAASYNVNLVNNGNALDTMTLSFTGHDFGTAFEAIPTAVPSSWVSFAPAAPSAPACNPASSVLTITVPMDWAGMEDTTYTFDATATSSVTPTASDTATGTLIVRATPLSMLLYVKYECEQLVASVQALPPSDVRDGLLDKATAACAKIEQAIDRYLLGDDPPASNLLEAAQRILRGFDHLLEAQEGKALTSAQVADLGGQTSDIRADLDTVLAAI